MNKNDISKKVYEAHGGMSYADAQKIVDLILETIKGRLSRGEKVLISGFGCFSVMKRKEEERRKSSNRGTDHHSRQECDQVQTVKVSEIDLTAMQFVAKKLYYKIREVCEIVGVEAHVLRFWETEFPALSPPKSKSGQRTYRPKDIELLLRIRKLLYEDGFTIAGARKKLGSGRESAAEAGRLRRGFRKSLSRSQTANRNRDADRLKKVKAELENILTLLDRE